MKLTSDSLIDIIIFQEAFEHEMMRRKGFDAKVEEILLEFQDTVDDMLQRHDDNGDGYLTAREYLQDEL